MEPNTPRNDSSKPADSSALPPRHRGRRVLKWVVLSVLLLIVIGAVVLYINLNEIVRRTTEQQATNSLNLPTKVNSASVSLFGGELNLNNFVVGSPSGFESPFLIAMGDIDVGVKLSELREKPLRVRSINIQAPKLVIEMKGMNFNVKKFIDSLPPGSQDPKPADTEPLRLIINELKLTGAQVIFRPDLTALSSLPGLGNSLNLKQEYILTIPPLDLRDIGTGEGNQNGAAIKEVVTLLVTSLASKAAESDQLPPELRQVLTMNVGEITNMIKAKLGQEVEKQLEKVTKDLKLPPEAGKALEGVLKKPDEALKDPGKALEQGLGGLLNQGKKDKNTPATQPSPP